MLGIYISLLLLLKLFGSLYSTIALSAYWEKCCQSLL